jgi:seryl-tRNA synthetase
MHDIRMVRADPAAFDAAMARRGLAPVTPQALTIDAARRANQQALQDKQARRNALAKEIGQAKRSGADSAALEAEGIRLRDEMAGLEQEANRQDAALESVLAQLPNILDEDVPEGRDESANVVLHQHGGAPQPGFTQKQHFEIGEALGLMDFAAATKLAGARFTVLRGALARLERALGQWMLTLHTEEHGYTEAALLGECRQHARHRPVAEIRGRSLQNH